jgi:hypothetical protein
MAKIQLRQRGSGGPEPRSLCEAMVEFASGLDKWSRAEVSGIFGTTRSMVFGFAISWLFAGNPASPQSVPSSVLLNFFM